MRKNETFETGENITTQEEREKIQIKKALEVKGVVPLFSLVISGRGGPSRSIESEPSRKKREETAKEEIRHGRQGTLPFGTQFVHHLQEKKMGKVRL